MEYSILRLIFTLAVAFLISYAATPVVMALAEKIGAIDVPKDARRMHSKPIPRIGGLAIYYGFLVSVLCFCDIDTPIRGILLGTVIIVALGVADDCVEMKAMPKFLVQIAAALIVVFHGVTIDYISVPEWLGFGPYISFGAWSIPITVLWIVGVTNAVNLIDGLDGLAAGISTIASVSLFAISLITQEINIAILTAAVAGGGFGFLPYNVHPAKIFMGDTGATFLGYVLACVSVLGLFKGYAVISFAIPFLILGLPIFDTGFAIIRRVAKGKSPMSPDRGHLHHRLIDMGLGQKQAVTVLCILSALLSLSGVVLLISNAYRAILLIAAIFILTMAAVKIWNKPKEENTNEE